MLKQKIIIVIKSLFICIFSSLFVFCLYVSENYYNVSFEQLVYNIIHSEGTNNEILLQGVKYCLPRLVILTFILSVPLYIKVFKKVYIAFKFKKSGKIIRFRIFPMFGYTTLVSIVLLILSSYIVGFFTYFFNRIQVSTLYEDYYVDPSKVEIYFPNEKQNLIYIYLESMESTYVSFNTGSSYINLIPNLKLLAEDNLYFSSTDSFGGMSFLRGSGFTIASMVAQTSGIPMTLISNGNSVGDYGKFIPGAYSLGEILESAGYRNILFIGSDADFGDRKDYFTQHGNYEIRDYLWALDNGVLDAGYNVGWGYEDSKLFEAAKETLLELSEKDEPFNFTLLTTGTHFPNGYVDDICESNLDYEYANSISCSDIIVSDFIDWIKQQSFYVNTTVILVGDHGTMREDMTSYLNSDRSIYNVFINSKISSTNTKYRVFTALDMYPTTLAALGAKIDGDRLGLGVNLFSTLPTLSEKLGYANFNDEISKNSYFYNNYLLKDSYYNMVNK